ncbi:ABC transporter ATP-binding protein [Paraclostridium sp. AKS46]|uniref:ABC transporter ATP-binding protein n=1 Tax=Paraclostridium bifermentans TaxID=1490 RepID=A0A5P3XJM2_PARBF|nr:ABC transporter ATP-binding protein [Paraclostridium bifermentans]MCU9807669.1 ABC transporter ATP-binding protein [Paraclostridium sp. AKS46]QEZ70462.1 ABC transporter ATP-binding protein [Paraclostridium bifermentans]
MEHLLTVKNLVKQYEMAEYKALDDVSFDIKQGEFIAIMGASGSGKTTLLNVTSTIDKVDSGEIYIKESNIAKMSDYQASEFRKNELGFIFQEYFLLDSLTVRENLSIPLSLLAKQKEKIDKKIEDLAAKFGMLEQLDKYPYQLSGGQKQRVAVIRAIIKEPTIVFADEPTGALDSNSTESVMNHLSLINNEMKATIMMVTHDSYAASYANRVIFFRDGKIVNEILKKDLGDRDNFQNEISKIMLSMTK